MLTDKGTLDAVGLMADSATHRATYKRAAWNILHDNGLLIITSCNSTAQELMVHTNHSPVGNLHSLTVALNTFT